MNAPLRLLALAPLLLGSVVLPVTAQSKKTTPPPTEQDLRIKAAMIKPQKFCITLGRVLRKPDITERGQLWEKVLLQRGREFEVGDNDIGYIRDQRLRIGMTWCAAYAAIGEPDYSNRTVTASGERHQLVYSSPRRYVYIDRNRVTSWQD